MLKGSKGFTYFSQQITIAQTTTGKKSAKINLPGEYNIVTGIAISAIDISNQANFKLSLINAKDVLLQDISNKLLSFDDSVPPNYKLLSTLFPYKDTEKMDVVVECVDGAVAGSDLVFDVIFKIEDNQNACDITTKRTRDIDTGTRSDELEEYATPN